MSFPRGERHACNVTRIGSCRIERIAGTLFPLSDQMVVRVNGIRIKAPFPLERLERCFRHSGIRRGAGGHRSRTEGPPDENRQTPLHAFRQARALPRRDPGSGPAQPGRGPGAASAGTPDDPASGRLTVIGPSPGVTGARDRNGTGDPDLRGEVGPASGPRTRALPVEGPAVNRGGAGWGTGAGAPHDRRRGMARLRLGEAGGAAWERGARSRGGEPPMGFRATGPEGWSGVG